MPKKGWPRNAVQPIRAGQDSDSDRLQAREGLESWKQRLPRTDVSETIHFSKTRCFMSLISLLLLVTDIPRTGLGVQTVSKYFPERAAPDTFIQFGPYAYHIAHFACKTDTNASSRSRADCTSYSGGDSMDSVSAWAYGYDTTSIGIRSVAELFNVTSSVPDFLLNRGSDIRRNDVAASISSEETFVMLDSVVEATQIQLGRDRPTCTIKSVMFKTRHNFIDRLHDYLLKYVMERQRSRNFVLQVFSAVPQSPFEAKVLCERTTGQHRFIRPVLCDHPVPWLVDNSIDSKQPPVPIWDHIATRIQALQARYQGLSLDVTLLSMQELIVTQSITRTTSYNKEAADVVVLVRGRACTPENASSKIQTCSTVFVDDYRYERYLLTTNVADWYNVTATLRGVAQVYVWFRLILLVYASCAIQPRHVSARKKLISVLGIIVKIPFHVVVYGSSIPVVCYVLAHLIDGDFVDTFLEIYWASIGGALRKADIVGFVRTASVQMRNVWLIALLATLRVSVATRRSRWNIDQGISGVRGLAISFTSFLSIFGPYRSISFRNTDVTEAMLIGDTGSSRADWVRSDSSTLQNIPIGNSMAMMFVVLVAVMALSVFIHTALGPHNGTGVLFAPSVTIPHAAGRLWPLSAFAIRFYCSTIQKNDGSSPTFGLIEGQVHSNPLAISRLVPAVAISSKWRRMFPYTRARSAPLTPISRDVSAHGVATRSLILLMNVTMMSDPWTFVRLFIVGEQLYIYEIQHPEDGYDSEVERSSVNILPYPPCNVGRDIGVSSRYCKLIDIVSSRDIPMAVVLHSA